MDERRLALSVFLSVPLMYIVYFVLSLLWPHIFPGTEGILEYAGKFASPVHLALPIGSAIFFYILLEWVERERILESRKVTSLLLLLAVTVIAYYVGLSGFYFFRFTEMRLHAVTFSYFLYVPYWTVIPGLLSAWISYVVPLPKFYKKKGAKSSR